MKIRIAKKVLCYMIADPTRKPSEQTPYNDGQILRASAAYHRSLRRWKRADVAMDSRPKWCTPHRKPNGTRQSVKRGPVFKRQ